MFHDCWCNMKKFYQIFGVKCYKLRQPNCFSSLSQRKKLLSTTSLRSQDGKNKVYDAVRYTIPTAPGEKKDMKCDLPAAYSPQYVEAAWYDWWVKQDFFSPSALTREDRDNVGQEKFVVCLPPPNVTGTLHLGHALTCSIQDALVRWNRMHGKETVWVPGCDHAGIATQVVVEKQLWRDHKLTRHDLGRDEFIKRVWEWKHNKGDTIYKQMKRLGSSLDWKKEAFTMDKKMSRAVTEAFVRLHDEGLIYRSNRLVNWSCQLKSAISDIEVENTVIDGPTKMSVPGYTRTQKFGEMMSFDYPVVDSDELITVSTTRLETMLGDTAVAVHPSDSRYTHLHGRYLQHPVDGRHIPVICDSYVDKEFGTGAVKITPAHDPNDYEIGLRHKLPFINVINDVGEMENVPDKFLGMKRFDARRKVEEFLVARGLFKEKKPHSMVLPICSRSKDVIEPRMKAQWYVNCDDMAQHAVQVVENGEVTFIPDFYRKTWFEFLKDSRDWCISRQIWWGHRIPAYRVVQTAQDSGDDMWISGRTEEEAYCKAETQLGVSRDEFTLEQDEDVLDTWFSSALFPFSVHGWPDQTEDLNKFYPSSLLETGSDIIFFWVARMVMMGYKMTGQLPFSQVLLHGILRDAQGRKMSKSLGNVIDPMDVLQGISLEGLNKQLELSNLDPREVDKAKKGQRQDFPNGIPECGADALRFALCSYNFKETEINMNILHVQSYRHFCNKIWQAFKFVKDKLGPDFQPSFKNMSVPVQCNMDRWILSRLSHMVHECNNNFSSYDLQYATKALHSFWFQDFCDIYLEYTKKVFQSDDSNHIDITREVLYACLDTFIRAVSPFMPYISEELFQRLPSRGDNSVPSVCVAPYPQSNQYTWYDSDLDGDVEHVREVCTGISSVILGYNLPRKTAQVFVKTSPDVCDQVQPYKDIFTILTKVPSVAMVTSDLDIPRGCVLKMVRPGVDVYVRVEGVINFKAEVQRLQKKKEAVKGKIGSAEKRRSKLKNINNNNFYTDLTAKIELMQEELDQLENCLKHLDELDQS